MAAADKLKSRTDSAALQSEICEKRSMEGVLLQNNIKLRSDGGVCSLEREQAANMRSPKGATLSKNSPSRTGWTGPFLRNKKRRN